MDIVITQWALDSYLDLRHENVFTKNEFDNKIKLDVRLLIAYPGHPKFKNGKFWSSVSYIGYGLGGGFKMKWHQVGNGRVQLRLPVAVFDRAYLCEGYVKKNDKVDKRKLARFKTHLQLIQEKNYQQRGIIK